jgi:Subtilase family
MSDVIVKFRNEVALPYVDNVERYLVDKGLAPWKELVTKFPGISIRRIYVSLPPGQVQELETRALENNPEFERPYLLRYFRIECPSDTDRQALAEAVSEWEITELAYVPLSLDSPPDLPRKPAALQGFQAHLNPAPESIGAAEAWLTLNADGRGMKFIDLERGWVLNHVNFINPATAASVFSVADPGTSQFSIVNTEKAHGASVLGTIAAPDFGGDTIGIAFRASGQVVSINRLPGGIENIHDAITVAARLLSPGDVLLIEAQTEDSMLRWWPVEANLLEYKEICTVVGNKIVVIEPAGNGSKNSGLGASGNDLDLFAFPGTVAHILDRNSREEFRADSGAILVGSATSFHPHSRMARTTDNPASNYGSRVDCYAWGENISTTGAGPDPDDYEGNFGGTSGASAMIAGVALIVQGLAKANGKGDNANRTYSPERLRAILTDPALSTPSANPASDHIGRMPNLVKIIRD